MSNRVIRSDGVCKCLTDAALQIVRNEFCSECEVGHRRQIRQDVRKERAPQGIICH